MSSIHKDPKRRSPFFYCAYTLADGTRRFRSTRKTKKGEALTVCSAWEAAARAESDSKADIEILNEMRAARGRPPIEVPSIRAHLAGWLTAQKSHLSDSTHKRYATSINKLLAFLGKEADAELSTLRAEKIEEFQAKEQDNGLSAKTLKLDLKAYRAALGKAFKRGHVIRNVAETVEPIAGESGVKKAFTLQQVRQLLDKAEDEWYGLIYIGFYTGLRLGDAARLRWDQTSIEEKTITLYPDKRVRNKTREPLQIPIHKNLLSWLQLTRGDHPNADSVLPTLARCPLNGSRGLSNTFSRLIAAAGIENKSVTAQPKSVVGEKTRGRNVMAYSFHSLRSTFNTQLEAVDVSQEVRMKLSDHTSSEVNSGYTKTELTRLAAELAKLPAV